MLVVIPRTARPTHLSIEVSVFADVTRTVALQKYLSANIILVRKTWSKVII